MPGHDGGGGSGHDSSHRECALVSFLDADAKRRHILTNIGQEPAVDIINLYEAKTHLSELVERAAQGEEIIIAKAGRPLARLVALAQRTAPRPLGLLAGQVTTGVDFDDPLPEEMLLVFEGRGR
jgi:prevent-host-death family protein